MEENKEKKHFKNRFTQKFVTPPGPQSGYNKEEIKYLCEELVKWSLEKNAFHLAGFSTKFNRTRTWLYKIAEEYSQISHALAIARDNLANKYNSGMMQNQLNTSFGEKYYPIFDKEYKELLKWKEEIKKQPEEKPQLIPSWEENNEFMSWKANKIKHKEEYDEFLKWKKSNC